MRTVQLRSGEQVSAIGQGTWYMGERKSEATREVAALQLGIDLGNDVDRHSRDVRRWRRGTDRGPGCDGTPGSGFHCEQSVSAQCVSRGRAGSVRAQPEAVDHRPYRSVFVALAAGGHPLAETVAAFEALRKAGKIRYWGVSNLDVSDMEEVFRAPGGDNCTANQVL